MRAARCELAWMAEALDDGRLSGTDLETFQRHAGSCEICRRASALALLVERMRALPEPAVTDLHHRQLRRQVVARAAGGDAQQLSRAARTWLRFAMGAALLAVTAAVVVIATSSKQPPPLPETVLVAPPRYEVTDLSNASWRNEEEGTTARVTLLRGSAAFHVHKLHGMQRFLVALPDGEVEVRGTRFVVDVEDGRTVYVVVMEGKVVLRQPGAGERVLIAGERWDARALAPKAITAPMGTTASATPPRVVLPRRASHAAVAAKVPVDTPGPPTVAPVLARPAPPAEPGASAPAAAPSAASDLFARAMEAFRAGHYDEADRLCQAFLVRYPSESRAEDAAFLRAVGRSRLGDARGAAALAGEYLRKFPQGMRRREAESISRASP